MDHDVHDYVVSPTVSHDPLSMFQAIAWNLISDQMNAYFCTCNFVLETYKDHDGKTLNPSSFRSSQDVFTLSRYH